MNYKCSSCQTELDASAVLDDGLSYIEGMQEQCDRNLVDSDQLLARAKRINSRAMKAFVVAILAATVNLACAAYKVSTVADKEPPQALKGG